MVKDIFRADSLLTLPSNSSQDKESLSLDVSSSTSLDPSSETELNFKNI